MMEGADGWLETRGALEWLGKSMVRLAVSSAKPRRRRTYEEWMFLYLEAVTRL
jgi:hypothetical protein